jgi:hypothetical protein
MSWMNTAVGIRSPVAGVEAMMFGSSVVDASFHPRAPKPSGHSRR